MEVERRVVIELGWLMIDATALDAAELRVVTRKT
jgi:hypothetical protein